MSSIDIDKARLVSPTLRRRRSSSTQRAVGTRERMAMTVGEKKVQVDSRYLVRAEPLIDEFLHGENTGPRGRGPWIALLLACASAGTGVIIFSALQNT